MVELTLDTPVGISVGALGRVRLPAGRLLYVGSAQRGLRSRVARHFGGSKRLRWHIDYLTARRRPDRAVVWELGKDFECRVARALLCRWPAAVVHFGSSDCACPSHLIGPVEEDWVEHLGGVVGPAAAVMESDG